ncbi:MAG: DUF3192 domain-containing protein [Gammaproteobacteria bacterium]|nr:DUF3192 domain-containing protein [Gammaproteobacteria bacterium]
MDKKVVKFVGIGFGIYAIFAASVITFYEEDTEQMGWEDRQAFNLKYINGLNLDKDILKVSIIADLGPPDITEAKQADEHNYQVMFYRTQHQKSDGITTKDECTPILFKDGKLIAWGPGAYEQYNDI